MTHRTSHDRAFRPPVGGTAIVFLLLFAAPVAYPAANDVSAGKGLLISVDAEVPAEIAVASEDPDETPSGDMPVATPTVPVWTECDRGKPSPAIGTSCSVVPLTAIDIAPKQGPPFYAITS
jgi:hypothetical protein